MTAFNATESHNAVEFPSRSSVGAEWVLLPIPLGGGVPDSARPSQRTAMKRFTDTSKWSDPWFMELSVVAKLLWFYLLDNCDNAGVINFNSKLAAVQIGEPVKEQHFSELKDRVQSLECGKLWIPKFIAFQYGVLSPECRPHAAVLELVERHRLKLTLPIPYSKGIHTLKEKEKDKEREKEPETDKEKERGCGGDGVSESKNGTLDEVFVRDLLAAYRRPATGRLTYAEHSTLAEIIREHPRYRDEWDIIITLKQREPRYFPQSLSRLLSNWQETLDRAANWAPDPKQPKTITDRIMREIDSITRAGLT